MDCPNTRTILIFNSLFAVVSIVAQRSYCQIDESRHAKSKTAGVVLTVTDEQGDAINDADVSVMEWTGTYQPYLSSPVVYREGRFYFGGLDIEKMLYLKVNADGFAPSIQSLLSLTEGESRAITFKLSRPATGCIYVVDPEGKPVSGATISALLYHDVNKNEVYVTAMTSDSLSFSFAESDASGVLKLPPLPKHCKATITVFHHDWLIGKAMDAVIIDGLMCSVILEPGVRVECHLKQRAGDDQNLEGKLVNVKMYSNSRSQIQPTNFIAAVPIARNRIVFTANPVEYNQLILELDSHVLGPNLLSSTLSIDPRLDLTNEQPRVFEFQALQKVKVKGRLVDSKGEGIAKALVLCSVAADETTPWQSKSKEKDPYDFARQWPRAGNCESDSEGNYEVDLAYGKAILQVIREGYFADPATMEFEVTADEDFIVPHVVLYPVPKLRGKIIYEDGSPAVGAYVRMRHSGIGDADPIAESNEDGLFTLIPSRIPNTDGSGIEANVFVVVMDTKTGKGGVAKVNLKDAEDCDNILVRLEPRSTSWMFDIVKAYRSDVELEAIQKDRDSASKEFTLGTEGMQVPSMREGTWLNTDAKGLEDFQGNFVLLDFWFIGCGPCHRDIPSIRMVHRHLSKYGFSVVSVHKDGEAPEDVKIFADKNDMRYPIVVDDAEGTITKQFRELGLIGFPHYILLDRQGRIIHNDAVSGGPSLRSYKFEKVFQAIRNATPN